ncbi:MAG: hypothetical protein QOE70_6480 [Chthoniobacter sp.]|jgi:glucose/arabinose dehydrogenase|nr:hypothetical protein [Chthoniobacter sp.]
MNIRRLGPYMAWLAAVLLAFLASIRPALAITLPPGFTETRIASLPGYYPTCMAFAPDGRIFVCDKGGAMVVVRNGIVLAQTFVTLNVDTGGERGLLGVAFDPSFAVNQFVYIYYTVPGNPNAQPPVAAHNRVSRFTASGDIAVPGSELILFELDSLSSALVHNGGCLKFGLDGKLYIAVGENSYGPNAQSFTNLLGKILRINPDGTIPGDNPFLNQTTGRNQAIWAMGLRNPFTFNIQPGTGKLMINDVGGVLWEEVNAGVAGGNYGWPATEGATSNPNYLTPLYAYPHPNPDPIGTAICGGSFYNPAAATPQQFPASYVGKYFFADCDNNWIKVLDPANGQVASFASAINIHPVCLEAKPDDGGLYYLTIDNPAIRRIYYTGAFAPIITDHPVSQTVSSGHAATFTVTATGDPAPTYQWKRDGATIPNATSTTYVLANVQVADSGAHFWCVATNASGSATSNVATLDVTQNQPPTPTIVTPADGTHWRAGDTIAFSGQGLDAEDGTLPDSAFTWQIDLHHLDHFHPFLEPTSGFSSGAFVIPTVGETSPYVAYRIYLTVNDSGALSTSTYREITPLLSNFTLAVSPASLQLTLDGIPQTTPTTILGVVGMTRTLGAASPQTVGGVTYKFVNWSDGGGAIHDISTPAADATFTANFQRYIPKSTIGAYRPSIGAFYLKNVNSAGAPDFAFIYGNLGDIPLVGDWNGDGTTTVGIYRPATSTFFLHSSNSSGPGEVAFQYGNAGDLPIVGDWDGNGTVTVGVFRPSNATFYLRNSNTSGFGDVAVQFGVSTDIPIAGDWDGNGTTTIGNYRPADSRFRLRNSNTPGNPDFSFNYGLYGDKPIVGDWNADGTTTIGVFRSGYFYLRNSNSPGVSDQAIPFSGSGFLPLAGDWDGQ